MRRTRLSNPRPVPFAPIVGSASEAAASDTLAIPATDDLIHDRLAPPVPARRRMRKFFDPISGWFRRTERWVSHELSRSVYPRLPLISRCYDAIVRRSLTVSEADVEIERLPSGFDGLRVLLVTDIHAGPFVSRAGLAETFSRIAALEYDVVLLGGDLATSRVEEFAVCADLFEILRAPLGTFAVLGNHDHYTGEPERLAREVEAAGIRLLENRSVVLRRGGDRLALAGIDDLYRGNPDLDAALRGVPPGVVTVLLSHNPDVLFDAVARGVELVLAGHTHAGQVRVPGLPVLVRMSRYRLDEGRFRCAGTDLVVSRGLGVVGLPVRVACPPEVVLIRLRRPR